MGHALSWGTGLFLLAANACHDFGGHAPYRDQADATGGAGTDGGAAGTASVGGAGDDDAIWPAPGFCAEERTIVPECYSAWPGGLPVIGLRNPRHIALNTTRDGGWHVVVSEKGGDTMRVAWGDDTRDLDWRCFDTLAHANRVAGASLTNDISEFYATTDCGDVFVRRITVYAGLGAWTSWTPFGLPTARSFALDVATSLSTDGINYVFIIDRGRVFQRHRVGEEYAAFTTWQRVHAPSSERLAAGLRADGRQQLFVLDEAGEPFTCIQVSSELGADFSACVDFGSADVPKLVHITAPYRGANGSPVFALDIDGAVWVRLQDGHGEHDPWQPFEVTPPEALVSIAGGHVVNSPGDPLRIAGITSSGLVYMIVRRNGVWGTWKAVL